MESSLLDIGIFNLQVCVEALQSGGPLRIFPAQYGGAIFTVVAMSMQPTWGSASLEEVEQLGING